MLRERFSRPLADAALALSHSVREDEAILPYDLWGSIAHARMLGATGLIPRSSAARLESGLRAIGRAAVRGAFTLDPALEDVHLNVEAALSKSLGADGERLHTARSRNDQVATDLALYLRDALLDLEDRLARLVAACLAKARGAEGRGVIAAWTHLQPAQRVYWAQILGTHALRFQRDAERLAAVRLRLAESPLGSAAIAGSSLPIDRQLTSRLLGFVRPSASSIDAVSDRDASLEALFALAVFGVHASALAEELVIGAMPEVGRVRLDDAFSTTSSLMPHKRNPDLAELIRAEAAPAVGRLTAHLTLLKGLPIGYQRDLQAGKPIVFEAVARSRLVADVLEPMVRTTQLISASFSPVAETGSVELADALVVRGVPFREAHARVAAWIARQEAAGRRSAGIEGAKEFPELAGTGFKWPRAGEEPERRSSAGGSARRAVDRLLREVAERHRQSSRSTQSERRRIDGLERASGLPAELFERVRAATTPRPGGRAKSGPGRRRRRRTGR